jgi:hypothetical protein
MTLKSANIDTREATRNTVAIVAGLKVARDDQKRLVIAWPHSDGMSTRWHGESGLECACGCGPVQ